MAAASQRPGRRSCWQVHASCEKRRRGCVCLKAEGDFVKISFHYPLETTLESCKWSRAWACDLCCSRLVAAESRSVVHVADCDAIGCSRASATAPLRACQLGSNCCARQQGKIKILRRQVSIAARDFPELVGPMQAAANDISAISDSPGPPRYTSC